MKYRPINLIIVITGAILSMSLWQLNVDVYWVLTLAILTVLVFITRAYINVRRMNRDERVKEYYKLKKSELQKKWGVLDYLNNSGVEGRAKIQEVLKVENNIEGLATITMQMEIIPLAGVPIIVETKRDIPVTLIHLFNAGNEFKVKYDETTPRHIIFISTVNRLGEEINLQKIYSFC